AVVVGVVFEAELLGYLALLQCEPATPPTLQRYNGNKALKSWNEAQMNDGLWMVIWGCSSPLPIRLTSLTTDYTILSTLTGATRINTPRPRYR
ncbi:hypothetical protein M5D96_007842, partial [Drosophila gunungcola]